MKALMVFLFSSACFANNVVVGVGANYGGIYLPSQNAQTSSSYEGPGALAELRFRFYTRAHPKYGVELFTDYTKVFEKNTGASDRVTQDRYGGGMDARFDRFLFGLDYHKAQSQIVTTTQTYDLRCDLWGARLGYRLWHFGSDDLYVYGGYKFGTILTNENPILGSNQPMQVWTVDLVYRFSLIGDRYD